MLSKNETLKTLEDLKRAESDLELLINHQLSKDLLDNLTIQRLKKCYILIKENIVVLQSKIYPDIIA